MLPSATPTLQTLETEESNPHLAQFNKDFKRLEALSKEMYAPAKKKPGQSTQKTDPNKQRILFYHHFFSVLKAFNYLRETGCLVPLPQLKETLDTFSKFYVFDEKYYRQLTATVIASCSLEQLHYLTVCLEQYLTELRGVTRTVGAKERKGDRHVHFQHGTKTPITEDIARITQVINEAMATLKTHIQKALPTVFAKTFAELSSLQDKAPSETSKDFQMHARKFCMLFVQTPIEPHLTPIHPAAASCDAEPSAKDFESAYTDVTLLRQFAQHHHYLCQHSDELVRDEYYQMLIAQLMPAQNSIILHALMSAGAEAAVCLPFTKNLEENLKFLANGALSRAVNELKRARQKKEDASSGSIEAAHTEVLRIFQYIASGLATMQQTPTFQQGIDHRDIEIMLDCLNSLQQVPELFGTERALDDFFNALPMASRLSIMRKTNSPATLQYLSAFSSDPGKMQAVVAQHQRNQTVPSYIDDLNHLIEASSRNQIDPLRSLTSRLAHELLISLPDQKSLWIASFSEPLLLALLNDHALNIEDLKKYCSDKILTILMQLYLDTTHNQTMREGQLLELYRTLIPSKLNPPTHDHWLMIRGSLLAACPRHDSAALRRLENMLTTIERTIVQPQLAAPRGEGMQESVPVLESASSSVMGISPEDQQEETEADAALPELTIVGAPVALSLPQCIARHVDLLKTPWHWYKNSELADSEDSIISLFDHLEEIAQGPALRSNISLLIKQMHQLKTTTENQTPAIKNFLHSIDYFISRLEALELVDETQKIHALWTIEIPATAHQVPAATIPRTSNEPVALKEYSDTVLDYRPVQFEFSVAGHAEMSITLAQSADKKNICLRLDREGRESTVLYQSSFEEPLSDFDRHNIIAQISALLESETPSFVLSAALKKYCAEQLFSRTDSPFFLTESLLALPAQDVPDSSFTVAEIISRHTTPVKKIILHPTNTHLGQVIGKLTLRTEDAKTQETMLNVSVVDTKPDALEETRQQIEVSGSHSFFLTRKEWAEYPENIMHKLMHSQPITKNDTVNFLSSLALGLEKLKDSTPAENKKVQLIIARYLAHTERNLTHYLHLQKTDQARLKTVMLNAYCETVFFIGQTKNETTLAKINQTPEGRVKTRKTDIEERQENTILFINSLYELLKQKKQEALKNCKQKNPEKQAAGQQMLLNIAQMSSALNSLPHNNRTESISVLLNMIHNQLRTNEVLSDFHQILIDHFMRKIPDIFMTELFEYGKINQSHESSAKIIRKYIITKSLHLSFTKGIQQLFTDWHTGANTIALTQAKKKLFTTAHNATSATTNYLTELLKRESDTTLACQVLEDTTYADQLAKTPDDLYRLWGHYKIHGIDTRPLEAAILKKRSFWKTKLSVPFAQTTMTYGIKNIKFFMLSLLAPDFLIQLYDQAKLQAKLKDARGTLIKANETQLFIEAIEHFSKPALLATQKEEQRFFLEHLEKNATLKEKLAMQINSTMKQELLLQLQAALLPYQTFQTIQDRITEELARRASAAAAQQADPCATAGLEVAAVTQETVMPASMLPEHAHEDPNLSGLRHVSMLIHAMPSQETGPSHLKFQSAVASVFATRDHDPVHQPVVATEC